MSKRVATVLSLLDLSEIFDTEDQTVARYGRHHWGAKQGSRTATAMSLCRRTVGISITARMLGCRTFVREQCDAT